MRKKVTLKEYIDEVNKLPRRMNTAAVSAIRESFAEGVAIVVEEIQHVDAVSSGELQESVHSDPTPAGATLYVDAPHAGFVEKGTRPHWPPPGPIFEWVMRKGLAKDEQEAMDVTFLIQRHIATYGTAPRKYFERAMKRIQKNTKRRIKVALAKL